MATDKRTLILEKRLEEDKRRIQRYAHLLEGIAGRTKQETFTKKRLISKILENQRRFNRSGLMNEDTTTQDISLFQKYTLPLIRRIYSVLPIDNFVGIQPLDSPAGLIFTMEAKYTNNKAPIAAGTSIYDHPSENYASSFVDGEIWKSAGASTTSYTGSLGWIPIKAGTVVVTIGSVVGTDADTSGVIAGSGIVSGTINYNTGEIAITLSVAATVAGSAAYEYNSEAKLSFIISYN